MPPTLDIALVNTTSSDVYVTITGLDIDNGSAWFVLKSDGRSAYHPTSPGGIGTPLAEDCAVKLGHPGESRTVTIPHIAGGRIYFSVDKPLTFLLNPGPALVEPSVTNPSDPNINIRWGFCEFTFNADQLYANISYVDFVGLPVSIELTNESGASKKVLGMPAGGLETVCKGLEAQSSSDGQGWGSLIVKDSEGGLLRALSPNQGCVMNPSLFNNYYEPYVQEVWSRFQSDQMTIDTQAAGVVHGKVEGDSLTLDDEGFSRPSTRDIFNASSGPFQTGPNAKRNAIIPRLNAEFNRSTYLVADTFPAHPDYYYKHQVTNHYARLCHAANLDGRGYAHPYDDATPSGGPDQSGFVNDPNPKVLTVTVGGGGGGGGGDPSQQQQGMDQQSGNQPEGRKHWWHS